MTDARYAKLVLMVNGLVPAAMLAYDGLVGPGLGANPIEFVLHTTGMLALVFLTLSLAVTPARKISGINFLSNFRKMLGLFAFFYGVVHLLTYSVFNHGGNIDAIIKDTIEHPYIALGMLALFVMLPLAVTSTNGAIKRMGAKNWKRLHMLAYLAAVSGVLHYWLLVKKDTRLPMLFAVVVAALLLYRVYDALRPRPARPVPPKRVLPLEPTA
jgi:methionine sulfoxide reductase heme-binding subunit